MSRATMATFHYLTLLHLAAVASLAASASENDIFSEAPVVCFKTGCVRGTQKTVEDKTVNEFYGIPYAMQPTGAMRFKKPQPQYDWGTGIYNATVKPPSCPQVYFYADERWNNYDLSVSEDCLYLNVWTPDTCQDRSKCTKKPVIVFIHGGAFTYGGSERASTDMSHLSAVGDVVSVSFNYRLNALGFLYARHRDLPGNAGLFDQNLALKWVKDNIEYFGGDPDSITVMGHGAGAQSVGYHMLSPMSRNLFKRAILLGGSPYTSSPLNRRDVAYNRALTVARKLGCLNTQLDWVRNSSGVISCLQQKDALDVASSSQYEFRRGRISLSPVFGDEFLPKTPRDMMQDIRSFSGMDVLMGITEEEGSELLYYGGYFDGAPINDIKMGDIRYLVGLYFGTMYKRNASPVSNYYLNMSKPSASQMIKAGGRAIGDGITLCPGNEFGESLANLGAKVYYFMLTQQSSFGSELFGPTHGEDMLYMLGSMNDMNANLDERRLSEKMMKMVGEFTRSGTPSMPTMMPSWPTFSAEKPQYVTLSAHNASVHTGPRLKECSFWKDFWRIRDRSAPSQNIVLG
ncbi:unnamed protein product [Ixodes persulcatus]